RSSMGFVLDAGDGEKPHGGLQQLVFPFFHFLFPLDGHGTHLNSHFCQIYRCLPYYTKRRKSSSNGPPRNTQPSRGFLGLAVRSWYTRGKVDCRLGCGRKRGEDAAIETTAVANRRPRV